MATAKLGNPPQLRDSTVIDGLGWSVCRDIGEAADIWRWLETQGSNRVFQSFAWISTWYEAVGKDEAVDPRLVVGWKDGWPCLLFPLGLKSRLGFRCLVWLAESWNDYNAPIVSDKIVPQLHDGIIANLWAEVAAMAGPANLLKLVKQSPLTEQGRSNPLHHPDCAREDNAAYVLDLDSDVSRLLASIHSPKTWKGFARKARKLEREGVVEFERPTSSTDCANCVRQMLRWKSQALHARGVNNPFAASDNREFLATMAQRYPRISRIYGITLNKSPIALALCLTEGDNLIMYQTAYDEAFAKYSPGALLIHWIIKKAAAERFLTFDFSYGDDPYKVAICNRKVMLERAIVPLGLIGAVPAGLARAKLEVRRLAKKNKQIRNTALLINRRWQDVQTNVPRFGSAGVQ